MSRSRRTRRSRRGQPAPRPARPAAPPTPGTQLGLGATVDSGTRATSRRRAGSTTYPHVGGEVRRVAGVSLASFGLLALLIAVDRLR
jgi:hypothetical protein